MPCYQKGVRLSYKHDLYRQNYYGCIDSEKERFFTQSGIKRAKKRHLIYFISYSRLRLRGGGKKGMLFCVYKSMSFVQNSMLFKNAEKHIDYVCLFIS
ncbi:MAG: hypothetical protein ACYDDB_06290 [bacterium]